MRCFVIARCVVLCLLTLTVPDVAGQDLSILRDTSYTLQSTLRKIKNQYKYREVTAALPGQVSSVTVETDVIYRTTGTRKLTANLFYFRRTEEVKLPAVLMIHGGGWRAGDKSLMTPIAERLAEDGYFAMAVEYRLSPEAVYPAAVEDLYAAIAWLHDNSDNYPVDIHKLAIMGCSAGGQLATLVGTTYNKPAPFIPSLHRVAGVRISAIIDIDGLLAFRHPDSQEGSAATQWLGGTYDESPHVWKEASALTHADQFTPPTLFLASKYPRFLAGRQEYIAKLDSFGVSTKTYFLDDAPHSFWLLNPWFEPTVQYVRAFLDEVF